MRLEDTREIERLRRELLEEWAEEARQEEERLISSVCGLSLPCKACLFRMLLVSSVCCLSLLCAPVIFPEESQSRKSSPCHPNAKIMNL